MLLFQWSRWPFELWCGILGAIAAAFVLVPIGVYLHAAEMREAGVRVAEVHLQLRAQEEYHDYLFEYGERWRKTVLLLLDREPTDALSRWELADFIEKEVAKSGFTDEERQALLEKVKRLRRER